MRPADCSPGASLVDARPPWTKPACTPAAGFESAFRLSNEPPDFADLQVDAVAPEGRLVALRVAIVGAAAGCGRYDECRWRRRIDEALEEPGGAGEDQQDRQPDDQRIANLEKYKPCSHRFAPWSAADHNRDSLFRHSRGRAGCIRAPMCRARRQPERKPQPVIPECASALIRGPANAARCLLLGPRWPRPKASASGMTGGWRSRPKT